MLLVCRYLETKDHLKAAVEFVTLLPQFLLLYRLHTVSELVRKGDADELYFLRKESWLGYKVLAFAYALLLIISSSLVYA